MDDIKWLNSWSRQFLENGYLPEGVTPEKRINDIADAFAVNLITQGLDKGKADTIANKFYDNMCNGYYSLSSPVWANYGTARAMPVSCFGHNMDDTMDDILTSVAETGQLIRNGGGTSGYFGNLRSRGSPISIGGYSNGPVHFMSMFDSVSSIISQSNVRRGYFTPYLNADHPDIMEFLEIGLEGNTIQDMTTGVVCSDRFMANVKNGISNTRKVWSKILQTRNEIGYPYIMFSGNANNGKPKWYKDQNREIVASNMCAEIMLPSTSEETFVCVLSSMNLLHYDKWKGTDAVEVLFYFLDTVNEEFVRKSKNVPFIERARNFAKRHKALGLGVLGLASYYQSKMIPFESKEAARLNYEMFKLLDERTKEASKQLAIWFGESEVTKGTGYRNATRIALAPTKSSSFILGQVSPSIEPIWANAYIHDLAKIKVTVKNTYLADLLDKHGTNNSEVWDSIMRRDGSVQHLDFLSDNEKAVFKTFAEINPETIINLAAIRQDFIDQGQSLNLMIDPQTPAKEINRLMYLAWESGLKSLYYQHNINAAQALLRSKTCEACQA